MHALDVIKTACAQALAEDQSSGTERFRAVADPATVLELATMLESLLLYVEKSDDLTAQELAREVRHRIRGDNAEGAV